MGAMRAIAKVNPVKLVAVRAKRAEVTVSKFSHPQRIKRHKQQGVALIFVLMIFVIMTVIASRIVTDLQLNTEKTVRLLEYQQANHYALSGEQFAIMLLEEDALKDKQADKLVDHWFEAWAANDQALETDDGEITMLVVDDQGRFNLNLVTGAQTSTADTSTDSNTGDSSANSSEGNTQNPASAATSKTSNDLTAVGASALSRLLEMYNIDARLVERFQDWTDDNQEPRPAGAEDNEYLMGDVPYRTGDTDIVSASELRLLNVLTPQDYQRLVPLISVLPPGVGINMNTVTAESLVALGKSLSLAEAKSFIDSRPVEGFAEIKEVVEHPLLKDKLIDGADKLMTLNSHYFSVYTKARFRDMTYYLHSQLARDSNGKVTVIAREIGTFPKWVERLRESVR